MTLSRVALLIGCFLLSVTSSAQAAIIVTVDKSSQTMSVVVDGVPRWQWPVSTGRSGYETPSGSYTAFRMEEDHYSKEWDDAPMPHSIFFTKIGHAIHGSFETKNLGRAASHGCVRLAPPNAAKLFALVEEQGVTNTKVVITGAQPDGAPAVARSAPRRVPQADEPLPAPPGYGYYGAPQTYGQAPGYGPPQTYGQAPAYGSTRRRYEEPQTQPPGYGPPRRYEEPAPMYGAPGYGWR